MIPKIFKYQFWTKSNKAHLLSPYLIRIEEIRRWYFNRVSTTKIENLFLFFFLNQLFNLRYFNNKGRFRKNCIVNKIKTGKLRSFQRHCYPLHFQLFSCKNNKCDFNKFFVNLLDKETVIMNKTFSFFIFNWLCIQQGSISILFASYRLTSAEELNWTLQHLEEQIPKKFTKHRNV